MNIHYHRIYKVFSMNYRTKKEHLENIEKKLTNNKNNECKNVYFLDAVNGSVKKYLLNLIVEQTLILNKIPIAAV